MKTIRIEEPFFRTAGGLAALKAYRSWKASQHDQQNEGKILLKELGLVRDAAEKIPGGIINRIVAALDGTELTLPEIVESINETLHKEGHKALATEKRVTCALVMQLLENKRISRTEARVSEKHGKYSLNPDFQDETHPTLRKPVTAKKGAAKVHATA